VLTIGPEGQGLSEDWVAMAPFSAARAQFAKGLEKYFLNLRETYMMFHSYSVYAFTLLYADILTLVCILVYVIIALFAIASCLSMQECLSAVIHLLPLPDVFWLVGN